MRMKFRLILILLLLILATVLFLYKTLIRDVGYLTRPLWDKPPPGWRIIPHYNTLSCPVYGWADRTVMRKVYDIVPFSVELDILELRLLELWDVVDCFIVVESNSTFSGAPKKMILAENIQRFKWASSKLVYHTVHHYKRPEEHAFANENRMRSAISETAGKAGIKKGDLVINSDTDEIPSRQTIELFKRCDGIPSITHLKLDSYIYSFEFPMINTSWRATLKLYDEDTVYTHSRTSDWLFAGAGWHCSFCFPRVEDFQFKMESYSHNDRLTHSKMLTPQYIQDKVCSGKDIFSMFPEAYSYRELIYALGSPTKNQDFSSLPSALSGRTNLDFLTQQCQDGIFRPRLPSEAPPVVSGSKKENSTID